MTPPLPEGVYESLRTVGLDAALAELADLTPRFARIEDADAPHVLARHVATAVERALRQETDAGRRLALVNDLLTRVAEHDDQVATDVAEHLVVLTRETAPGVHRLERPVTPLSSAALITNAPEEPSLSAELRAELGSADRVDLLCAFVRWHAYFSPSTMYRDYAISPDLFHWESQNSTTIASDTGQRYLHHGERGTHVALFVRESPNDDLGSAPFLCLGLGSYESHAGERPIAITWRLRRPMPSSTFRLASVVA